MPMALIEHMNHNNLTHVEQPLHVVNSGRKEIKVGIEEPDG